MATPLSDVDGGLSWSRKTILPVAAPAAAPAPAPAPVAPATFNAAFSPFDDVLGIGSWNLDTDPAGLNANMRGAFSGLGDVQAAYRVPGQADTFSVIRTAPGSTDPMQGQITTATVAPDGAVAVGGWQAYQPDSDSKFFSQLAATAAIAVGGLAAGGAFGAGVGAAGGAGTGLVDGAFLGEGVASGVGAWDAAALAAGVPLAAPAAAGLVDGAFLGEGVASGVPAWDAAAAAAGVPLSAPAALVDALGPAPGNGAFLGENVASGVPAWDAAASAAGVPLVTPAASLPSVSLPGAGASLPTLGQVGNAIKTLPVLGGLIDQLQGGQGTSSTPRTPAGTGGGAFGLGPVALIAIAALAVYLTRK